MVKDMYLHELFCLLILIHIKKIVISILSNRKKNKKGSWKTGLANAIYGWVL